MMNLNRGRLVVYNQHFIQAAKEHVGELNVKRMSNVLSYSFFAIKCGFKNMCETLMQILYAHIFSPTKLLYFNTLI